LHFVGFSLQPSNSSLRTRLKSIAAVRSKNNAAAGKDPVHCWPPLPYGAVRAPSCNFCGHVCGSLLGMEWNVRCLGVHWTPTGC
jgi:hypothetical protein